LALITIKKDLYLF